MTDPSGLGTYAAAALHYRQEADRLGVREATSRAAGGRAGFTLDRRQADAMLTEVNSVLDELRDIRVQTDTLTLLKPPAEDSVSTGYNKKLTDRSASFIATASPWDTAAAAFDAASNQMQALIDYLTTLQGKLNKALGKVQATEQASKEAVDQAAPEDGGYM